jgi:hypothetical protein
MPRLQELWLMDASLCAVGAALARESPAATPGKAGLEFIRVSPDGRHFVGATSGSQFRPWGCNYDHDATDRLLETYWQAEWNVVAGGFAELRQLGAHTVRIHLQVSRFRKSAYEAIGDHGASKTRSIRWGLARKSRVTR